MKSKSKPIVKNVKDQFIDWKWIDLFVFVFAFILYANTLGHDFTVDDGTVLKNNKITTQGIKALPEVFSSSYRAGYWSRNEGLYRPLSMAMFAVEWQLSGGKPWLGHLINVLLYALTGIALLYFIRLLFDQLHPLVVVLSALLFIAHPIHTEVVANIKSRDELLAFFFGILSFICFVKYIGNDNSKYLFLSLLCFFLSLLSKESAVAFLGVYPLILWKKKTTSLIDILKSIWPFLLLLILFLVLRTSILGALFSKTEILLINNSLVDAKGDFVSTFATASAIFFKYIGLLLLPITLTFDYSYATIPISTLLSMQSLTGIAIVLSLLYWAYKNFNSNKIIAFGILFFFGTFILVSNFFFLIESTMAERFVYTPSFGFILVAMGWSEKFIKQNNNSKTMQFNLSSLKDNQSYLLISIAVLLLFSFKTINRNSYWKNNLTLLKEDIQHNPNSSRILYAYGSAILIEQALNENDPTKKNNYLEESIKYLNKGVALIPNYNDAWYNLGLAYKELGNADKAIHAFETARSYKEFNHSEKFVSLGTAYGMKGNYEKSILYLKWALDLDSNYIDALNNLGLYYCDANDLNSSLLYLNKAIAKNPKFEKAYYNRGNTWAKGGQYRNAIQDYLQALALNSNYGDAFNNLGNCYAMMQKPDSARVWFEKAVQIDPSNGKAFVNLGITCNILGDTTAAQQYFLQAKSMGFIK